MNALSLYTERDIDPPIGNHKTEKGLILAAQRGDRAALEHLVKSNQLLVLKYARSFYLRGFGGDQELLDLVQWGNMGLMDAIRKFSFSKGRVFSTYAVWWITAYIRRYGKQNGVHYGQSFSMTVRDSKVRFTRNKLYQALQREPTPAEIASYLNLEEGDVVDIIARNAPLARLDGSLQDAEGEHTLADVIPDPDTVGPDPRDLDRELIEAIKALPYSYRQVLMWRYGLGEDGTVLLYRECAARLGLSKARVQQIEQAAIKKLRQRLSLNL